MRILIVVIASLFIVSCKPKLTVEETKMYQEKGLHYAFSTKAVLGKNLMGTIQSKGTNEALKFCNIKALYLTDSMSKNFNVNIKRVSDKPRNLSNTSSAIEQEQISVFKQKLAANEEIEPVIKSTKKEVHFYYPIITNQMCLQCHGTPQKEIKPTTLSLIKKLYPNDKAQNYGVNQVRGIWSISFKK